MVKLRYSVLHKLRAINMVENGMSKKALLKNLTFREIKSIDGSRRSSFWLTQETSLKGLVHRIQSKFSNKN